MTNIQYKKHPHISPRITIVCNIVAKLRPRQHSRRWLAQLASLGEKIHECVGPRCVLTRGRMHPPRHAQYISASSPFFFALSPALFFHSKVRLVPSYIRVKFCRRALRLALAAARAVNYINLVVMLALLSAVGKAGALLGGPSFQLRSSCGGQQRALNEVFFFFFLIPQIGSTLVNVSSRSSRRVGRQLILNPC